MKKKEAPTLAEHDNLGRSNVKQNTFFNYYSTADSINIWEYLDR